MQTLYTLSATGSDGQELNKKSSSRLLNEKLDRSLDLFILAILYTVRTAQYSETSARQRASRYLTTTDDLNVNTKIAENGFLLQLMANESFNKKIKDHHLERLVDEEWVKKLYQELVKSPEYTVYISSAERTPKLEKEMIRYIWDQLINNNEALQEFLTDEMPDWEDDHNMTAMLMDNLFKNSAKINFDTPLSAEKHDYAHDLLNAVLDKEAYCMELIKPKLANWDTERVAVIDMLLLKMGVCELLYFPTIPTKVTINEYIEVAKLYSTPQSGHFVNGVLDNILKDLEKENLIRKQERNRKS
ncbi:MAG: transcription antitermination factor NusB [Taibaiella sp.]|nr:transcription antitermination factor NusB [Taibaiella sp.]